MGGRWMRNWLVSRGVLWGVALSLLVGQYRTFDARIGYISTEPMYAPAMVMITFFNLGVAAMPLDRVYAAPSISDVQKLIDATRPPLEYVTEAWDCDDYSRSFKEQLQRKWRAEGTNPLPLAVGEVYAVIKINRTGEEVAHAFNVIMTDQGKLVWVEPQKPRAISGEFTFVQIIAIIF